MSARNSFLCSKCLISYSYIMPHISCQFSPTSDLINAKIHKRLVEKFRTSTHSTFSKIRRRVFIKSVQNPQKRKQPLQALGELTKTHLETSF